MPIADDRLLISAIAGYRAPVLSGHLPRGTASARLLLALGVERGLSAEACLRRTGLTEAQLADPLGQISAQAECRLIENLVATVGEDAGIGLDAGCRHVLSGSGQLGFACLSSPTLRSSLEFAVRYQDLGFTLARANLVVGATRSHVEVDVSELPPPIRRFVADQQLASIWTCLPLIAGPPPTPHVELSFPRPRDADRYAALFGVEPRFGGTVDRIGLLNAYLDAPLPQADGATLLLCEEQCDGLLERRAAQVGVAGLVRDRLTRAVRGMPSMEMVAADIHMTTRTLRRRLSAEGTSFREVDRAVRLARAEELLRETDLSVEAIAQRTGYATSSAFVHAFTRWRGATPGAYRAQ
jgi:AraC-like DNA-binding protein